MRKAVFYNLPGKLAIRRARAFDQCDGLRQKDAVTTQNAIDYLLARK